MNGRAPEYVKCNEQTLVKVINGERKFITFWKNVHQQFLISEGTINGATYSSEVPKHVTKEDGNKVYIECRRNGWKRFEKSELAYMLEWLPRVLF